MNVYPQNPWPFYHWSLGGISKSLVLGSFAKGLFPIKDIKIKIAHMKKYMRTIQGKYLNSLRFNFAISKNKYPYKKFHYNFTKIVHTFIVP